MPGLVLSAGAVLTCAHGGQVKIVPAQVRAAVSGTPICTAADTFTVVGCPGIPASPGVVCTTLTWQNTATRVTANGVPVLVQALPPAGPVPGGALVAGPPPPIPLVSAMQLRVVAT
jgi:hypothetical protein